jgi:predicted amidophosphoribosyltransferase
MLDLLFPPRCVLCQRTGPALCRSCRDGLPPAGPNPAHAPFAYTAATTTVIAAFKFQGVRALAGPLAEAMVERLGDRLCDVTVTWAPTDPARRRQRGFDQAELLASAVANCADRPLMALLRRGGPAIAQTGRNRLERHRGPRLDAVAQVLGPVLIVDDVVTTGATLAAAAAAVLGAGAERVTWAAAAATPSPDR